MSVMWFLGFHTHRNAFFVYIFSLGGSTSSLSTLICLYLHCRTYIITSTQSTSASTTIWRFCWLLLFLQAWGCLPPLMLSTACLLCGLSGNSEEAGDTYQLLCAFLYGHCFHCWASKKGRRGFGCGWYKRLDFVTFRLANCVGSSLRVHPCQAVQHFLWLTQDFCDQVACDLCVHSDGLPALWLYSMRSTGSS